MSAPRRRWQKHAEHIAGAVAAYHDGVETPSRIAARVGVSVDTLLRWVRDDGGPVRGQGRPRRVFTAEEVARLRELVAAGVNPTAIARVFHCSNTVIVRYKRELGLTTATGTPAVGRRRCPDCLAVFSLTAPACPNGHAAPEVA